MRILWLFAIAFILFAGIYLWVARPFQPRAPFATLLFQVDTARLTTIVIQTDKEDEFLIRREQERWYATDGRRSFPVPARRIGPILADLRRIPSERLVSQRPDDHPEYAVDPTSGLHIQLYAESKLLEDFYLGSFHFEPALEESITYFRLAQQKEVFAIDAYRLQGLRDSFVTYLDPRLFPTDNFPLPDSIELELPDTSIWFLPDNLLQRQSNAVVFADTAWQTYVKTLSDLPSLCFAEKFDESKADEYWQKQLRFAGKMPVTISLYVDTVGKAPAILHSTLNPYNYFLSKEDNAATVLFEPLERLLALPDSLFWPDTSNIFLPDSVAQQ